MSKSTPSTTTTVQQNPLGQAQSPYLTGMWDAASYMGGRNGVDPSQLYTQGQQNLNQINNQTQADYNQTAGLAQGAVPNALNFTNQALAGTLPQSQLPGGPQIGGLNQVGTNAQNTGLWYGNAIQGAAAGTPGAVAPYADALRGGAAGAQQTGLDYGSALSNFGYGAAGAGQGYGGALANAAGMAPGAVAPSVAGLQQQAGQFGGLSQGALGAGMGGLGALSGLAPAAMGAANPAMAGLYGNAGMGVSGNPIYNSLMGMANGQYTDPRTNPALGGTLQAANQALSDTYQTATAPGIDSNFEGAGRYGSGSLANTMQQAQVGLGRGLAAADSSIVNNAYNTGLQAQLGAGQALGGAFNTGMANANQALSQAGTLGQQGVQNAGSLINQGYTQAQQGYQNAGNILGQGTQALNQAGTLGLGGVNALMQGLQGAGGLVNQGYATGAQALGAGAGAANQGYATAGNMLGQGGNLALGGQNTLVSGLTGAAGAANQGYNTSANALSQGGNLANSGTLNLGGIAQMTPDLANYPLSQLSTGYNAGWAPIQNYGSLLGQPIGGNTMTTQTTPMYQNWGSQLLSGALGAATLASKI